MLPHHECCFQIKDVPLHFLSFPNPAEENIPTLQHLFFFSEVCGGEPRSTHFNTNDRGSTQFCLRYMLRDGHDSNTDEVEIYNNHTNAYRSLMTKRICVLERTGRKLSWKLYIKLYIYIKGKLYIGENYPESYVYSCEVWTESV